MKEGRREGRLSTLVELFPNPRRDLNGCQSFPVLGLVAREKLPSKGVKLAPVGPFRPTMRVLGTNAGFVSGLQTICTRASRNAPLSFASLTFLADEGEERRFRRCLSTRARQIFRFEK